MLVTAGGGSAGEQLRAAALAACEAHGLEPVQPGAGLVQAITEADVAVSGAGLTAYELACAGVPAALIPIAPNQERVAAAFGDRGLAVTGADPAALVGRLADARASGSRWQPPARRPSTATAPSGCATRCWRWRPGRRVAAPLRYRPATAADSARQLEWRNDPATRAVSRTTHEIQPDEHDHWFEGVLADRDRRLLVAEDGAVPAASVRFDLGARRPRSA